MHYPLGFNFLKQSDYMVHVETCTFEIFILYSLFCSSLCIKIDTALCETHDRSYCKTDNRLVCNQSHIY